MIECPACKQSLTLMIEEELDDMVLKGRLTCRKCSQEFPIENSIPNFLPPDLR